MDSEHARGAPELLPCPFCGSPAPRYQMAWGIRCTACDASVPCLGYDFGPWNRRATPAALAASPEVAALIREAEARGREAGIGDVIEALQHKVAMWEDDDDLCDWAKPGKTLIAEAAALRGEKPLTEYERKVAQMKEDFPNGI